MFTLLSRVTSGDRRPELEPSSWENCASNAARLKDVFAADGLDFFLRLPLP